MSGADLDLYREPHDSAHFWKRMTEMESTTDTILWGTTRHSWRKAWAFFNTPPAHFNPYPKFGLRVWWASK